MEYIIIIVIAVLIAAVIVRDVWATRQLNQRYAADYVLTMIPHKKFSLAEYYEQIERAQTEILQERENEPKYEIILWWGLDGCKLDGDGNVVWISKREEKSEDKAAYTRDYPKYYLPFGPCAMNYDRMPYYPPLSAQIASGIQMTNAAIIPRIAEQRQAIETEIKRLELELERQIVHEPIEEFYKSIKEHTS